MLSHIAVLSTVSLRYASSDLANVVGGSSRLRLIKEAHVAAGLSLFADQITVIFSQSLRIALSSAISQGMKTNPHENRKLKRAFTRDHDNAEHDPCGAALVAS